MRSGVYFYPFRSCFLINTADRIIRVYDGREILTCGRDGEPEPMQKLQDLVNRYVSQPKKKNTVLWGHLPLGLSFQLSLALLFVLQDTMEEMLLFWGWRIHSGGLSPAACLVYLGEEHRQPGEDSARDQRRATFGCSCKQESRFSFLFIQKILDLFLGLFFFSLKFSGILFDPSQHLFLVEQYRSGHKIKQ